MTAVNVYLFSDCACVMTDGSTCNLEGVPDLQRPKVSLLPHLSAVLAIRGPMCVAPVLTDIVTASRASFDDAQQHLGTDLQTALAMFAANRVLLPEMINVFLVGYSEKRGEFETWYVGDTDAFGATPFIPQECGSTQLLPNPQDCDAETQRLARLRIENPEQFDPMTHGVYIMEGQARLAKYLQIGGFCQVAWVRQDAIETQIVRRWR